MLDALDHFRAVRRRGEDDGVNNLVISDTTALPFDFGTGTRSIASLVDLIDAEKPKRYEPLHRTEQAALVVMLLAREIGALRNFYGQQLTPREPAASRNALTPTSTAEPQGVGACGQTPAILLQRRELVQTPGTVLIGSVLF